jgi:hypothetical protein
MLMAMPCRASPASGTSRKRNPRALSSSYTRQGSWVG